MDHTTSGFNNEAFFELLTSNDASKRGENQEYNFGSDDLLSSFDYHPFRRSGSTDSMSRANNVSQSLSQEGSLNSNSRHRQPPASSLASSVACVNGEPSEPRISTIKKEMNFDVYHATVVTAVERTMKKYADNLLRVLEGMSGRLSQLELVTQGLEQSVREVRCVIANNHGEADGKLRTLSNRLSEIHRTVQLLRDKQEIAEAQAELEKLQLSKVELSGKGTNSGSVVEGDTASQAEGKAPQLPSVPLLPAPPLSTFSPQVQAPTLGQQSSIMPGEPNANTEVQQHTSLPLSSYNSGQQLTSYYATSAQPQQSQTLEPHVSPPLLSSGQLHQSVPRQPQAQQPVPQKFPIEHLSLQHANFQESMPQQPQIHQTRTQQSMPQQAQEQLHAQQLMRQTAESQHLPPQHSHFPQSVSQQTHVPQPLSLQTQIQQPFPQQTQIQQLPQHTQVQPPTPQQQFQQPMPQHVQSLSQQEQVQGQTSQQAHLQQPGSHTLHSQQLLPMQAQAVQQQMPPRSQSLQQHQPSSQVQPQQVPGSHMFQPFPQPAPQRPFQQFVQLPETRPYNPLSQGPSHPAHGYLSPDQFPYASSPYLVSQQSGSHALEQQKSFISKNNLSLPLANSTYDPSGVVPPSGYGGSLYRVSQPGSVLQSANPRLPTAQPVGTGFPSGFLRVAASPASGGNNSMNRTPVDEIIERVAAMGFSRDQVRPVVQKLTENGQSVDLNAVLDKLMNDGMDEHSQRNWYTR